jgi:branched-chain amino acid transport system ATP-binding protein
VSVLKVNNLSKDFGGIKAVSNVNMSVEQGEIVGLIGPNGAGKTTLFNLLTGIYTPTNGDIVYDFGTERIIKNIKPYAISDMGVSRTFQNIRLFKEMTVADNVRIGFHNNIKYGWVQSFFRLPVFYKEEKKADSKVMELLKFFNLEDKKDELAKNLPYGEQRLLEIARALASNPKILLLDEPAAGMNPNETHELMKLIKVIRDTFKLTIILIEHDMPLVMGTCDRIFVLDYGILIADGTPEMIRKNPKVIKAYLGGEEEAC